MQYSLLRRPSFRSDLIPSDSTNRARPHSSQRCSTRVLHASSRSRQATRAQAPPAEDQQEQVEYKDTWSDVQFINMCRKAYGNLAGWQSPREWQNGVETYQGMLEVSRALMKVLRLCVHHL